MTPDFPSSRARRRRGLVALAVVAGVATSLGMSFAAVPLYRAFCQATGFGGTTQVAAGPSATHGQRTLAVRFDANVAPGLAWRFEPEVPEVSVRTGATTTVFFKVTNRSDRETEADAVYNVTPDAAGIHFNKISCFCFSRQRLGPHETAELPVVFFLDPSLDNDETMARIDTLTLSYTFFAAKGAARPVAEATPVDAKPKL